MLSIHRKQTDRQATWFVIALASTSLFGLVDLALTLHAMLTTGMFEDNPLIVGLIHVCGSPLMLVAFKLLTLAIGCGLLYRFRGHRAARIGAYIVTTAFGSVLITWVMYFNAIEGVDPAMFAVDPRWIKL